MSWDQFQQEFIGRFFPQSHNDSQIKEFFRVEHKNMSISEYEKRFSDLVRFVPYIQVEVTETEVQVGELPLVRDQ